jgi:probable rRNA maturation factor
LVRGSGNILFEGVCGVCYDETYMEINILFDEGFEGCLDAGWLEGIARAALAAQGVRGDVEMGLVVTGQERIQELNRTYRGQDKPTDVLAFALLPECDTELGLSFTNPPDGVRHLGEVIISYPQAVRQAEEQRHSLEKEVAILVIHGVLHLLGYDHIKSDEAALMSAKEAEILKMVEAKLK